MRYWGGLAFVVVAVSFFTLLSQPTHALGLKVAPLEYKATLKADEQKKGFIDISNPASGPVNVAVSVQAFRQIDDDGGLQFYDDKQTAAGIRPDLTSFELGPREALRLFFTIDSKLLAEGDVYGAVFFTTEPKQAQNGVGQSVRVGTLLSLVNKAPGSRTAEITKFNLPLLQLGDTAKGEYRIKNTGPSGTGFYPKVRVSAWPGGATQQNESSLIFGGRERANDISFKIGFGIHRVEVAYGDSKKTQWVVAFAPWMLVTLLLVLLIVGMELLLLKKRRKHVRNNG